MKWTNGNELIRSGRCLQTSLCQFVTERRTPNVFVFFFCVIREAQKSKISPFLAALPHLLFDYTSPVRAPMLSECKHFFVDSGNQHETRSRKIPNKKRRGEKSFSPFHRSAFGANCRFRFGEAVRLTFRWYSQSSARRQAGHGTPKR